MATTDARKHLLISGRQGRYRSRDIEETPVKRAFPASIVDLPNASTRGVKF
jgi:hypothetical protein